MIATFAFYIFPKPEDLEFKIIEPTKIADELTKGRDKTDFWFFTGGTGIFTRAVTLPQLAKQARKSNKPIEIKLQILDPTNDDICEKYANYRRGLNTASNNRGLWTKEYVRNHSIATIVKSAIISSHEPLVEIEIGLKGSFSLFRLDLSSTSVIVTKEDPREVAFIFYRSSSSFNSYFHEFKETMKQTVLVKKYNTSVSLDELDKDSLMIILRDLDFNFNLLDNDISLILELTKNAKNPYA